MVKLQKRTTKKRYLNNKRIYTYQRVSLDIPSRFHAVAAPFFDKDLGINVSAQDAKMLILLERKPEKA